MNPKDHGECFVLDDGYDAPAVLSSPSMINLAAKDECLAPDSISGPLKKFDMRWD